MIADNYTPVKALGNGTTVNFSYSFAILAIGDERVYLEDVTTGVQTLQTYGTHYTLTYSSSGGIVTFLTAPTSAYYVIIGRETAKTQSVPLTTSSGFQAKVIEGALDKLTTQIQDVEEKTGRSVKLPLGSSESEVIFPAPVADNIIGWDATGTALENKTGLAASVAAAEDAEDAAEAAQVAAETAKTGAETAQTAAEAAQAIAEDAAANIGIVTGTFTNASLSAGVLTVTHNKGLSAPYGVECIVTDNDGKRIFPDNVTGTANSVAIDLTSFGTLTGTWGYKII